MELNHFTPHIYMGLFCDRFFLCCGERCMLKMRLKNYLVLLFSDLVSADLIWLATNE